MPSTRTAGVDRAASCRTPSDLVVHYSGAAALAHADEMLKLAQRAGLEVKRLSVRSAEPNFQIHVCMPGREQPARAFFEAVQAIVERLD